MSAQHGCVGFGTLGHARAPGEGGTTMANRSAIQAYVDSQLATSQDQLAALQRLGPSEPAAVAEPVGQAVGQAVLDTLRETLDRYVLPLVPLLLLGALPLLTALVIWGLGVVAPAASILNVGSVPLPVVLRLVVAACAAALLGFDVLRWTRGRSRRRPSAAQLFDSAISRYASMRHRRRLVVLLLALVALLAPLLSLAPRTVGHLPVWVYWTLDAVPAFAVLVIVASESFIRGLAPGAAADAARVAPLPAGGLSELQERVARLKQMQEWLADDKLRALVDDAIGQQVIRSERRQTIYAVIAAVASLIVGWLLSAITPASILAGLLGQAAH
jgi:hypothetical protein